MPSPTSHEPSKREQTFLFADLAGYTALTEVHGDEEAADLVDAYVSSIRTLLAEHDAEEVKTIGDALLLRVPDPAQAVRLGVRITREVGQQHGFPAIRVGMHHGPAVERDGDWFGTTVNVAARVSALATAGEVLLTGAVADEAGPTEEVGLAERGRHPLKGIAEPIELYAAVPHADQDAAGLPLDPVCHMAVDPERCAGMLVHRGQEYHFCSLDCAARFAQEPDRYAGA